MTSPKFYHWLCLCCVCLALPPIISAQQMSPALQKVWSVYYSDVGGNDEERRRAGQELETRPEFKAEFLAMLQRDYFDARKRGEPGDGLAFGLLSGRNDLTPAEVKPISDELAKHVAENDESLLIIPIIKLLSHYPSPEHEDLVLGFLNRSAKRDNTLLEVFSTSSAIGGEKSLAAMREVELRLRGQNAQYWFLPEMKSCLTILQSRLDHADAKPIHPKETSAFNQPSQPAIPMTATSRPSIPQAYRTDDYLIWLGMLGGLILVVALSCRVFRK